MIDQRIRHRDLPPARSEARSGEISWRFENSLQPPDASELIWVEGDAELALESAAGRHRGMIVVVYGCSQGTTESSFIISYPVAIDDHALPHLPAVSRLLEAMGWSVLASRRGRTDGGDVNTAVLVSPARFGREQRLWLAEPVGTAHDRIAPTHARRPGPSAARAGAHVRTLEFRDQLETWVNEGGAGDDVAS